jgi:hypothetical protein
MRATKGRFASSGFMVATLLLVACNNDPGIQQAGGGHGGGKAPGEPAGGGNSGSNGGGGKGGSAPDRPPGGGAGGGSNAGGAGGGGRPDDKSCTATGAMAMPLPVDVYVLLDRSGSMLEPITGGGMGGMVPPMPGVPTKWDSMVEALGKFVNTPSAAGLQLGLGLFPLDGRLQCDVAAYSMPAVPVAALPGVAMPFTAAVTAGAPGNGGRTPTLPALQGAIAYAKQREAMIGRRVAIALATDGEPNVCNSNLAAVNAAAQAGAGVGILTFVIGVGPSLQNLNEIAVAGGTKMAYQVENATSDQLVAAFKEVQSQASKLVCSFMIPPAPMGMTLDPDKVNVRFNTMDPTKAFDIGQVMNRAACGAQGGWYYDNAMNPKTVNLCEQSCAKVNGSGEGAIQILFGCAGIVIK